VNVDINQQYDQNVVLPSGKVVRVPRGQVPPAGSIPEPQYSPNLERQFLHSLEAQARAIEHIGDKAKTVGGKAAHAIGTAIHAIGKAGGSIPPQPKTDVPPIPLTGAGIAAHLE
jgi:hypothetical protein